VLPVLSELDLPVEILNPVSGELVPAADLDRVTGALIELRDLRRRVSDAVAAFTDAVVAESQRQGTRTLTAGGVQVKVSAPDEIDWDLDVLDELRSLGLPDARFDELLVATVTYRVNGSVARQLAGASKEYAAVIERAKRRVPKRQYVTVGP
jgi:hypothetical protein